MKHTEQQAASRLESAVRKLHEALEERDAAIRDSVSLLSRRRAGEIAGLTPSRVQQIIDQPWTHRVRFVGVLDQRAERALTDAGMQIRTSHGGGAVGHGGELPTPIKHTIYLTADSSDQARKRLEAALKGNGSFASFKAEPVSPSQREGLTGVQS